MGALRDIRTHERIELRIEQEVGRAERCGIRLADPRVSTVHASIRWSPREGWQIRDLASRNLTLIDGAPVAPGQWSPLTLDCVVQLGDTKLVLIDDGAPATMLIVTASTSDEPERVLVIEDDSIGLPSEERPEVTVMRGADGAWWLEGPDVLRELRSGDTFEVEDQRYELRVGLLGQTESTDEHTLRSTILDYRAVLAVSRDEEHVDIQVRCGPDEWELPPRACNYLLLTLARAKLADIQHGLPEPSSGWVYLDELSEKLGRTPNAVNVDVYRIRKAFGALGIVAGNQVIERRPRTGQLRTSLRNIEIVRR